MTIEHQVVVSADGGTLWVNDPVCCIGRFSKRFGIDVHRSLGEQLEGGGECLYCTHEPPGPKGWAKFCFEMCLHYGVILDPKLMTFEAREYD
jgi:hypothetical protein